MSLRIDLLWLTLGWFAYAALHSFLAAQSVKHWVTRHWTSFAPAYRLAFNALAGLLILPLLWASYALPGDWLWRWQGIWGWLANGLALAALAGVGWSAGTYDMAEFLGIRPWRERRMSAAEHGALRISTLHRYVRHPWYSLALLLIWTRDMNAPFLVSACAMTLYFCIGSRLEERKLATHFGDAYHQYHRRVPGLIPLPWKSLTAAEAATLTRHV